MAKLNSPFVVKYNHSWIENKSLFIQMEYCFDNLKNVLTIKPNVFERSENQAMNSIEYFISCEIFRQITEALNYLHSIKPEPLIHRDLKPENILIGMSDNRRICKLADFGLSKFIEDHSDYHSKYYGTHGYIAPEVISGSSYDTKADVYSLGMICLKVFDLTDPEYVSFIYFLNSTKIFIFLVLMLRKDMKTQPFVRKSRIVWILLNTNSRMLEEFKDFPAISCWK